MRSGQWSEIEGLCDREIRDHGRYKEGRCVRWRYEKTDLTQKKGRTESIEYKITVNWYSIKPNNDITEYLLHEIPVSPQGGRISGRYLWLNIKVFFYVNSFLSFVECLKKSYDIFVETFNGLVLSSHVVRYDDRPSTSYLQRWYYWKDNINLWPSSTMTMKSLLLRSLPQTSDVKKVQRLKTKFQTPLIRTNRQDKYLSTGYTLSLTLSFINRKIRTFYLLQRLSLTSHEGFGSFSQDYD